MGPSQVSHRISPASTYGCGDPAHLRGFALSSSRRRAVSNVRRSTIGSCGMLGAYHHGCRSFDTIQNSLGTLFRSKCRSLLRSSRGWRFLKTTTPVYVSLPRMDRTADDVHLPHGAFRVTKRQVLLGCTLNGPGTFLASSSAAMAWSVQPALKREKIRRTVSA